MGESNNPSVGTSLPGWLHELAGSIRRIVGPGEFPIGSYGIPTSSDWDSIFSPTKFLVPEIQRCCLPVPLQLACVQNLSVTIVPSPVHRCGAPDTIVVVGLIRSAASVEMTG